MYLQPKKIIIIISSRKTQKYYRINQVAISISSSRVTNIIIDWSRLVGFGRTKRD